MTSRITRRNMLMGGAAAGAVLGLGDMAFLKHLRPVSAEEAQLKPGVVRLDPSIEPLVRLLEETPRERLLEEVADRIKKGLSYQEVLAALLLAGVRNVEPRPSVGFKFHAVLVVNSAHIASLASPPEHRWLPIFWALDYFKEAQAKDELERGWTMGPVDESAVPRGAAAQDAFITAMDNWDESGADVAVAGMARSMKPGDVYELFYRYGSRDFRSIGHKAIFVANSWRTLQTIGWQHAEPVLRSLAYALLNHEGTNPAQRDDDADRPFRRNSELATSIRPDWQNGKMDDGAVSELLQTLRSGSNNEACDQVVALLNLGISPQSIWDAQLVYSGELLMRQPGIVALHSVTTANATHFAYQATENDETRRLLLLQNAAFLTMFRDALPGRGNVKPLTIDNLASDPSPTGADLSSDRILAELSRDPMAAAQQLKAFLARPGAMEEFSNAARVLVFLKGNDAHDYKFSSAVLEDYGAVSPRWRDSYLAANIFQLQGAGQPDNDLVRRTREALA
ncbi:MAG: hypothetical protein KF861_17510 [Planctomycetaceae bacterium]|nr:hypothetical protein [Planctomycetaceae bacterium]